MFFKFCFSDVFDLEYGVGILRFKEGLYCEETNVNESLSVNDFVYYKADFEGKWLIDCEW